MGVVCQEGGALGCGHRRFGEKTAEEGTYVLCVRTASICYGTVSGALVCEAGMNCEVNGAGCLSAPSNLFFARFWEKIRSGLRGPASEDVRGAGSHARATAAEGAGDAKAAGGAKKLLFVCTANVCRSPMAEAIFNALASDEDLPYEARSAGVAALVGKPIAPHARAVLEEARVRAGGHRARQVDQAMIEEAELVLAMTPEHVAALHRLAGGPSEKVRTLRGYAEDAPDAEGIPDPYGMPVSAYRASAREIFRYVDRIVSRLKEQAH